MEPALRARIGTFRPGPREFFTEVDYRDPEVMRTHGYHWFDLARMANEPHSSPIRRGAAALQHLRQPHRGARDRLGRDDAAGGDVRRPAAFARADLRPARPARRPGARRPQDARQPVHSRAGGAVRVGQHAARVAAPRRHHVRGEQHLYLQQPAYGTSYLIGKMQIEKLLAARRRQLGDAFTIRRFMDEFEATGLIPMSLITWELTGEMPAVSPANALQ